jgi:protein-tyrosine phosphatase
MNVLFVCTGNICRSPLAEGILRNKYTKYGIKGEIDSCGFEPFHIGDAPDHRAKKIAQQNDIDISSVRSRLFQVDDFDRFDKILVMDSGHYQLVTEMARNQNDRKKVDFIMNQVTPGRNQHVTDPYYDSYGAFEAVYEQLDKACETMAQNIVASNDRS